MPLIDTHVLGGEVDGGVAEELQLARSISKAVVPKHLHGPVHGWPTRLVFVKEISSQQDGIHVMSPSQLQDFFKGIERVVPTHRVLFIVSQMVVRGYIKGEWIY